MLTADQPLVARDLWKIQEWLEQAAGPSWQEAPAELPAKAPEILESCIRQIHAKSGQRAAAGEGKFA